MPDGGTGGRPVVDFLDLITGFEMGAYIDGLRKYVGDPVLKSVLEEEGIPHITTPDSNLLVHVSGGSSVPGFENSDDANYMEGFDAYLNALKAKRRPDLDRYYVSVERHEYEYLDREAILNRVATRIGVNPPGNYRSFVYMKAFRLAIEAERRFKRCIPKAARDCLASQVGAAFVEQMLNDYVKAAHTAALIKHPQPV